MTNTPKPQQRGYTQAICLYVGHVVMSLSRSHTAALNVSTNVCKLTRSFWDRLALIALSLGPSLLYNRSKHVTLHPVAACRKIKNIYH